MWGGAFSLHIEPRFAKLELELIRSHMAQKQVLRGEVLMSLFAQDFLRWTVKHQASLICSVVVICPPGPWEKNRNGNRRKKEGALFEGALAGSVSSY